MSSSKISQTTSPGVGKTLRGVRIIRGVRILRLAKLVFWFALDYTLKITGQNLKVTNLQRKIIFQTSIIVFHVQVPGCTLVNLRNKPRGLAIRGICQTPMAWYLHPWVFRMGFFSIRKRSMTLKWTDMYAEVAQIDWPLSCWWGYQTLQPRGITTIITSICPSMYEHTLR